MSTTTSLLLLPNFLFSSPTKLKPHHAIARFAYPPPPRPISFLSPKRPPIPKSQRINIMVHCSGTSESDVDCVGTGTDDVECFAPSDSDPLVQPASFEIATEKEEEEDGGSKILEWLLLVSPFFFWGTAMVAMKEVLPKTGPFFVASFRLIPAGALLVGFAAARGSKQPAGALAWVSIALFAAVDAACFQGFLAEGLQRTSAGLGSVIIDSQPLTVSILAALLFGESIGAIGAAGLVLGVVGLLLLEVPALSFDGSDSTIWGSGEWWMLLAAQSMAIGTVMVHWVSKYSDPVMATGWHMVIGGIPLLVISFLNNDPAISGSLKDLTSSDLLALLYTSIFGSAISYGVYFYNATRGSLTKLSSLAFLTPMFASIFGPKRAFGTARSTNVPAEKPLAKPLPAKTSRPWKPSGNGTQKSSDDISCNGSGKTKVGAKTFQERAKESDSESIIDTGKSVQDEGVRTPMPPLIKAAATGTPYQTAENCSKCRFDKLEMSAYWLVTGIV